MKKLRSAWIVGLVLGLSVSSHSADYECQDTTCFSKFPHDGMLIGVRFERGDIVSTEAGFVVDTGAGWVRVVD